MAIREWEWYENGKKYNKRLEPSYYERVDCNWDFFYGDQWRNAGLSDDLPQPVYNQINRFVTFFVASIMANKTSLMYMSPLPDSEEDNSDDVVNQSWNEFEEQNKLTWETKNALYDGAVTGDYVAHLYFDPEAKPYSGAYGDVKGIVKFERIDPNNFYVSDPNKNDVQSQDYIQIVGRSTIKKLNEEKKDVNEMFSVTGDDEFEEQASKYGRIELEGGKETDKATYVITYTKKKVKNKDLEDYEEPDKESDDYEEKKQHGEKKCTRVFASKCTKDGYIYKDVDLGIELYPVAHGNWELQRNTYHGMSFVEAMIPSQIFLNRAFAMAMYNIMTTAFPKLLYDKNKIAGFTSSVGGH